VKWSVRRGASWGEDDDWEGLGCGGGVVVVGGGGGERDSEAEFIKVENLEVLDGGGFDRRACCCSGFVTGSTEELVI